MRIIKRSAMMAGASAIALGMAVSGAQAFDDVNWDYDLWVDGYIGINVDINGDFDLTDLVVIEASQIQIGDVTATSVVTGITNNQPGGNGEDQTFTYDLGSVDVWSSRNRNVEGRWNNTGGLVNDEGDELSGACSGSGGHCEFDLGEFVITIEGTGNGDPLDAVRDLPEIMSTATAVGNNLSIEGPSASQFHVGQDLYGGDEGGSANVSALSVVDDIVNASVDSSATAVGNNFSMNVPGVEGGEMIVIGDLMQSSFADISAGSYVSGIEVNNYERLGRMDGPLVGSVATAVGNNANISVGVGNIGGGNGNGNGNGGPQ